MLKKVLLLARKYKVHFERSEIKRKIKILLQRIYNSD